MNGTLKHIRLCAASLLAACSVAHTADDSPTRRITLVVPFAAGRDVDIVSRLLAQKMADSIGQPGIVEVSGSKID
jgi:tripartite-type tricarboxylate transporter receptor subunit TctC